MGVEVPSNPINRKEQYLAKIAGQAVEIPAEPLTREEAYLDKIAKNGSGGGGGTTDYEDLDNLPKINSVELKGNKSLSDLGIASAQSVTNITNGESINNFADVETALSDKQNTLTFDDTPTDGSNNPVKSNGIYDSLAGKQNITDNTLTTTDKTVPGAINEIKSGLTNLDNEVNGSATTYPYADVITIEDAVPANLADCSVKVEPVQDLHGYDKPWVGGAYKNKARLNPASYKSDGYDGTMFDNPGEGAGVIEDTTLPAGTYTISIKMLSVPSSGRTLTCFNRDSTQEVYANFQSINSYTTGQVYSQTFTLSEETIVRFRLWGTGGGEWKMQIQLETGSTATSFAPYTNICPISGHTEAVVTRDGKNLLSVNSYSGAGGWLPSTTFAVTGNYLYRRANFTTTGGKCTFNVFGIKNGVETAIDISEHAGDFSRYNDVSAYDYIRVSGYSNNASNVLSDVMLCFNDNNTDTIAYEPYQGKTYTLALGDTIYGGTVDFDSGVMTVDRAIATVNDFSFSSGKSEGGLAKVEYKPSNLSTNRDKCLSNMMEIVTPSASWASTVPCFTVSGNSGIRVYYDGDTLQDFQDDYANIQIVYELATPFTVQLTPQQIQLLQGQNTLYASTGQISVTANGVSGSIGAVQEQVNGLAEDVADVQSGLANLIKFGSTTATTGDTAYEGLYYADVNFTDSQEQMLLMSSIIDIEIQVNQNKPSYGQWISTTTYRVYSVAAEKEITLYYRYV